jgi:hypothetical protein
MRGAERAAPAKKRVGLVKARAAALLVAREVVLGVLAGGAGVPTTWLAAVVRGVGVSA